MADVNGVLDGFYFDELSKLRVLDVDSFNDTEQLRDQSKEFTESMFFVTTSSCCYCDSTVNSSLIIIHR